MIRRTFFANEIMILLSFNPKYENDKISVTEQISKINNFFQELAKKHPQIKSIYFSHNTNKADVCIGDLECIYGKKTIDETLLNLTFEISPQSFFQTNSHGAEKLYSKILELSHNNAGTVLDLYG
jgi:23S rRNA (uracil1939-C5)-methyltransferase